MSVEGRLSRDIAKHKSRRLTIGYSLICLTLLLFCGSCMSGNDATAPNANPGAAINANVAVFTIDMYDNYYGESNNNLTKPPVWSVATGADVIATLINHGRRNHNWAIVKQGVSIPIPYEEGQGGDILLHGIGMVYSNSQTTVTFAAPEPGEYMVICTVSGHYPEMQGRLVVTAPKEQ